MGMEKQYRLPPASWVPRQKRTGSSSSCSIPGRLMIAISSRARVSASPRAQEPREARVELELRVTDLQRNLDGRRHDARAVELLRSAVD
jgi:hypothetical protein